MTPTWRVRYCDGSSHDDLTNSPRDLPATGVQTVVQWVDGNRQILAGFAIYYWMTDLNCWWGGDLTGYLDLAAGDDRVRFPKRGLNCREYQAVLDATVTDADFDPGRRVTRHG